MNFLVIGAGGVGGLIAAYLAKAGEDVTVIARGAHLEAIQRDGLRAEGTRMGDFTVRLKASDAEHYEGKADVILVCVKGYSLPEVLPLIGRAAHKETLVLPILNILNTGRTIAQALPGVKTVDGCTYMAGYRAEPGRVVQEGQLFRLVFGEREPAGMAAQLAKIANQLCLARFDVVLSDNIQRDAFRKFMYVSALATAEAYHRVPASGLQQPGAAREDFAALITEQAGIARARGFRYDFDMVEEALRRVDASLPGVTASMVKDLERGGQSEIDGLMFEPVRMGRELGVPTPCYQRIAASFGFR